ncbi:YfhO family protein [bacterium]|nr:YfhO family protein [bacterium]
MVKNKTISQILFYALSFFIPIALILSVCCLLSVFPFGDKSYIFWDSDLQFVPYLAHFKHIFTSNTDYIYSLTKAGGNGMFDFNACYINDLLNFLAFLFPNNRLDIAHETITIIKIGLCGLGFGYFLNHNRQADYKTLIFSTAYALSTCSIIFSQNVMGFQGMYLLPVALVGIKKLITEQKCLLFILTTALAFLLEPYAGWVVLSFSFLWFLYLYFLNTPPKKTFGLYVLSVIFIIALSAVITLPTKFALEGTKYSPELFCQYFLFNITDIFSCFYTGRLTDGLFYDEQNPLLYAGIIPFILYLGYFLNPDIERKKKVIGFLFSCAVLFIYYWHPLFVIFNGGATFPLGCIYRFGYIFILLFLFLASENLGNFDFKKPNSLLTLTLLYSLITFYVYWKITEGINRNIIAFDFCFGLFVLLILYLLIKFPQKRNLFIGILVIFNFFELSLNTTVCFNKLEKNKLSSPSSFRANYDNMSEIVNYVKEIDKSFYRIDTEKTFLDEGKPSTRSKHNNSMLHNYPSISHYSSLGNMRLKKLYAQLGFDTYLPNFIITFRESLPKFAPSFLGIKYIISDKDSLPYEKLFNSKGKEPLYLYENLDFLPIAFVSEKNILDFNPDGKIVVDIYNELPKIILGQDMGDIYTSFDINSAEFSPDDSISKIKATSQISGKLWLAHFINNYQFYTIVAVNNKEARPQNYLMTSNIEYLGEFKQGEALDILAMRSWFRKRPQEVRFVLFTENENKLREYFDLIRQHACNLEVITSSKLKGQFETTKDNQVLVLTIPYDKNFRVKIDGKVVSQKPVLNELTGIEITEKGKHTIEMRYVAKGLSFGVLISVLSLLLLSGLTVKNKSFRL